MNLVSDWAILNDTKLRQLQRILAEFHHLSDAEIHLACILLGIYHAVYRRDRLEQRRNQLKSGQAKIKAVCLPPTLSQLHEIAERVNAETALNLEPEEVITQLEFLAKRLRQYRDYIEGKLSATALWHRSENFPKLDPIQSDNFRPNGRTPFLQMYPI